MPLREPQHTESLKLPGSRSDIMSPVYFFHGPPRWHMEVMRKITHLRLRSALNLGKSHGRGLGALHAPRNTHHDGQAGKSGHKTIQRIRDLNDGLEVWFEGGEAGEVSIRTDRRGSNPVVAAA
eukprot:3899226-Pyramimonas_sp.AAC.1